jgi:hypothetical protein
MPRWTHPISCQLLLVVTTADRALATSAPTLAGDCDVNWSVDLADYAGLATCLSGPGVGVDAACGCPDLDTDGDVDLRDFGLFQVSFTATQFLSIGIESDADDGTEVDDTTWHDDGYGGSDVNRMGASGGESYDSGLRFDLPQVSQGETFAFARLVVPASDDGYVNSAAHLRVVGINQDSVGEFTVQRPSQLPKTNASVDWDLDANWPEPTDDTHCTPLYRYSPDISSIINEIVGRPGWGSGPDGKTLAVVVEDDGATGQDFLAFQDSRTQNIWPCPGTVSAKLELYRSLRSTLIGKEFLGRPTDHSVTVNAFSLVALEAYAEFGTIPGTYTDQTSVVTYPAETPIETVMDGLLPDTRYHYRLRYRRPNQGQFAAGPERTFHTQRPPGSTFTFAVQSDSHLYWSIREKDDATQALYQRALCNAQNGMPDFLVSLGDTFYCSAYVGRDVLDFGEALKRHLDQRPFLDMACHSAPFFFAIGNHEGEVGWRLDGTPDNMAVWATNARKLLYPLPVPDGFYTGNQDEPAYTGLREDYYAWEWGDALFIVLDPYWYTTSKPHDWDGTPGSGDNWDWTLGWDQYDWLRNTLEASSATFKFVFSHHVTGGVNTYGRGGVEAASHALGGRGSFEWGGESLSGMYEFDTRRPGWGDPIHTLMVNNGVSIYFHGHDHVFVKQELDGVVYQECPQPNDKSYGEGAYVAGRYLSGAKVNNSGTLRVTVSPSQVTVEYVRAYLPGDGPNKQVAYSYTIPAP